MCTFEVGPLDKTSTTPCKLEKPRFCQVPSPLTVILRPFDFLQASSTAFFIDRSLYDSNVG
ncbi:unnamed protein product, partial [Rotaria magnacalcarata]